MSEAQDRVTLILPGPLVAQGRAISAMLQEVFPPSRFQFKYLPARIDKASWKDLTQGNQPFIGLGYNNTRRNASTRTFSGTASWTLLVSVRRSGTPMSRFYGDPQGIGVLSMATIAMAVLDGRLGATGSIEVKGNTNVMAEDWTDDCAVIAIDLEIPLRLPLYDAISKPGGLGLFEEMLTTWAIPTPEGSANIFTSDWNNPNWSGPNV